MNSISLHDFPCVSIGVPVYNVEKYLSKCLDSLICQTLTNIEIILVDDGSTDTSGKICEEYALKDSRIKVIHKQNGGLATARQAALEVAKGEYFCVCDADDWVELNMYEKLYNKAVETDADIVMCDYYSEYSDGKTRFSSFGGVIPDSNEKIIDNALNGRFPCSVWSKFFKKDLFDKYSISWEPGINMGEDFLICLKILKEPVKLVYLPLNLYHYRRMPGENSYTNRITLSSYNQMLQIQDWIEKNFCRQNFGKGIDHYLINIAFAGLRVDSGMNPYYYKQTSVNRLKNIVLIRESSLKSFFVLLTKCLGYNLGRLLYKLMYKIVYK